MVGLQMKLPISLLQMKASSKLSCQSASDTVVSWFCGRKTPFPSLRACGLSRKDEGGGYTNGALQEALWSTIYHNLADGVFNSFVMQVTIFQTSTIAIFSLMVGQEIACSIVALVVALIFGLFFGLLFPLFVIYYKLNHLEVWVSDIVLHKSEVNAEAARVLKQFNELQSLIKSNSDLRIFTSSQPNDENQQPESDGEIHAESDGEIHFADAKQTKAGIGGAAQQPATQAETSDPD